VLGSAPVAADELPDTVIGVVAEEQDGLTTLEDFAGLDAGGPVEPVPHPPRAPIPLHDPVDHPPHERQIFVAAGLVGGQIRSALRYRRIRRTRDGPCP
jgi:hypothetical protein